jgi:hypothetical protein
MTTTLNAALLALSRVLQPTLESAATGGSTTTLVDAARSEPATYWTNGTIFILSGANAGKSYRISIFAPSTHTFTLDSTVTAIVAGVLYAAAPVDYPRWQLIQAINTVLKSIGGEVEIDETLTTVTDQHVYTLPTGVSGVKSVKWATEDADPYHWIPSGHWREEETKLIFDDGFAPIDDGFLIHLEYQVQPAAIALDADALPLKDDRLELVTWRAAVHLLRDRLSRTHGDEPWITGKLNEALQMEEQMIRLHPVAVGRDTHLSRW